VVPRVLRDAVSRPRPRGAGGVVLPTVRGAEGLLPEGGGGRQCRGVRHGRLPELLLQAGPQVNPSSWGGAPASANAFAVFLSYRDRFTPTPMAAQLMRGGLVRR